MTRSEDNKNGIDQCHKKEWKKGGKEEEEGRRRKASAYQEDVAEGVFLDNGEELQRDIHFHTNSEKIIRSREEIKRNFL